MERHTPHDELVRAFGRVVGVEKADEMVADATAELDIREGGPYATEDVVDICELIEAREEGYLAMLARDLQVKTQSDRRFNALLETIPDPTAVVSFENGVPIIETANSAFESVFGYGIEDVTGHPLPSLIRPDELHDPGELLDPELLAEDRIEREVRRQTNDGDVRDFLVRSMPLSTLSGETEAAIIHTDITEQKRRQHELERQNEQLEEFAKVVSHDLRNPLSVATGRVELLQLEAEGESEHLDTIERALDRMGRMIDNVLTLAKQGRTVGETVPVDLTECARAAWSNVESETASLDLEPDLPTVAADPDRLQEALENLFRNAIEHGGGDVCVRVRRTADGFSVSDDGPGLPPGEREEVFEHGYTTSRDGTGLGLAIVEDIVQAHGWEISIATPESNRGARFDVSVSPSVG